MPSLREILSCASPEKLRGLAAELRMVDVTDPDMPLLIEMIADLRDQLLATATFR